ncbi:calcium/sodium antiporter [Methanotorris formicicus]|uniref:Na+/Ca+ antiporter, CaCA family n=1 Tax=Methanotorris formicicus Mc-S-70 TaxID=647171 RepID=H1L102_9EURY|nr:calcium/sodium antiporter [Methanotorris formicicus]EHP84261.1 Na+/Ca+ antiporter, CaCA family [Methanotorris formicicus Mc-S-70]
MIIDVLLFIFGLILLSYGSDWFIVGSSRVAKFFKISDFVIGATIIAVGTSLPEIVTSVYAAWINSPEISTGNAIGSCIANVGLVLGLSLIFSPIVIKESSVIKNTYAYVLFLIIACVLGIYGFSWVDGIILVFLFTLYLRYTTNNGKEELNEVEETSYVRAVILLVIGLVGVILGSEMFVNGARNIALTLGVSEKVVGFTLVALGTSLPELAVSIAAAKKKLGNMVLGNIVGSNVANIGVALGLSAIVTPLPPQNLEMGITLFMAVLLAMFAKRRKLGRLEGVLLLIMYCIFLYTLFN